MKSATGPPGWLTILMLVFIPPVGIVLLWLKPGWHQWVKIPVTVVAGFWLLNLAIATFGPKQPPPTVAQQNANTVSAATATSPSKATAAVATAVPTSAPTPKLGDTVSKGNWKYCVTETDSQKTVTWSDFGNKTDAKGVWQIVHVKLENIGKETLSINSRDFEVNDFGGITHKAASDSAPTRSCRSQGMIPPPVSQRR